MPITAPTQKWRHYGPQKYLWLMEFLIRMKFSPDPRHLQVAAKRCEQPRMPS